MIELFQPFRLIMEDAFVEFCIECATPNAYRDFLYQTHFYVKETVPTIDSVIAVCPNHPLADKLANLSTEESGHDQLLIDDLRLLGPLPNGEISPSIKEFVRLERELRLYDDPVSALYGDIAVLDCSPPTRESIYRLTRNFAVPMEAASMLLYHAEADVIHKQWAVEQMQHSSIKRDILLNRAITVCRLFTEHWRWMKTFHS
jgi:hypothetical protein